MRLTRGTVSWSSPCWPHRSPRRQSPPPASTTSPIPQRRRPLPPRRPRHRLPSPRLSAASTSSSPRLASRRRRARRRRPATASSSAARTSTSPASSRARREVREFLADERPDKRARLIDRLLASPRYATHMATTWRNRILPQGVDPTRGREALGLQKWLRTRFADNLRYDHIVGGLLLANGRGRVRPGPLLPGQRPGAREARRQRGRAVPRRRPALRPVPRPSVRRLVAARLLGLAAFFARIKAPTTAA